MEYAFLIFAALWILQFALAYVQLRRFHGRIADLRRLGRTSVGMEGNRWRGRIYGVLVVDGDGIIRAAEVLRGWSVFAKLAPVDGLVGMRLGAVADSPAPLAGIGDGQWRALQHAASFLKPVEPPSQPALA